MSSQQSLDGAAKKPSKGGMTMESLWAEAAIEFKRICGKSLQKGDVTTFDDVRLKIESASKASYGMQEGDEMEKWDKAKSVGLKSLKYLKMLVGVASQASGFV